MKWKIIIAALVLAVGGMAAYALWPGPQERARFVPPLPVTGREPITYQVSVTSPVLMMTQEAAMRQEIAALQEQVKAQENPALARDDAWTPDQVETLRSLWIGSLPPPPPDPSNRYADDPRAAALGHRLFFDTRFSIDGSVACATCHVPKRMFTDGRMLGVGNGLMDRKTMTIAGDAYSRWHFWDGRADSQWAQALGPLESRAEHAGTRTQFAHLVNTHYRAEYEAVFGAMPDLSDPARFPAEAGPFRDGEARSAWEAMRPADREAVNRVFVNIGKAIAAYERQIVPGPARFDRYVEALLRGDTPAMRQSLTASEVAGLRLFIGEAGCVRCHHGPLLTSDTFHNTGVPPRVKTVLDPGRQEGVQRLLAGEFHCLSPYSDASPDECDHLKGLEANGDAQAGAFKPPTLRNIAQAPPYMHAGQFGDLLTVIQHYRQPPAAALGANELEPLALTNLEIVQLLAFLESLNSPFAGPPELLAPPQE